MLIHRGSICRAYPINTFIISAIFNEQSIFGNFLVHHLHTYRLLILLLIMVPPRDVIIPNAIRGIQEVVVTHTRTNDGTVRTSEKIVPIVVPKPKHPRQTSKSKKKVQTQTRRDDSQGQAHTIGTVGGAEGDHFIDDQECPGPEPTLEDGQPRTTVCLWSMHIDRYTHISQTTMEQWIQFRSQYLHILLEMEGKPISDTCSVCRKCASVKCPDCFGSPSYCRTCVPYVHWHSPFHRPLLWTATHYTQVSLQSLGFALYLGHSGAPCPSTVEVCTYAHIKYAVTELC